MTNDTLKFVFFDIGGTLGKVHLSADGKNIERIDVFPGVAEALRILDNDGVPLGIISDAGTIEPAIVTAALDAAGLLQFLTPSLIVFGAKNSTSIFLEAAALAGQADAPQTCLFVGENPEERHFARLAKFRTASSPDQALEIFHL